MQFETEGYIPMYEHDNIQPTIMLDFTNYLKKLTPNFKSTLHRLMVFPTYNMSTILIKSEQQGEEMHYSFRVLGVPATFDETSIERQFVFQNMKLEYIFQYLIADIMSQLLIVSETLLEYSEHFTKLANTVGQDMVALKYYENLLSKKDYLKFLIQKT